MNISLQQLQIFQLVAQLGSLTKAAEAMRITQPAVSMQLKNFQEQFSEPLLETRGKRIYLTDYGQKVLLQTEATLESFRKIYYLEQEKKGQLIGQLKVAVVSTGKYIMPYFLSAFLEENPGVELRMMVTNRADVIEKIKNNEVDFGLISLDQKGLKLERIELMDNLLYLVSNKVWKDTKKLSRDQLKELRLIYREEGSGTRLTLEKFMQTNKLNIPQKLELSSNEAVKQAVIAGLGYSVMPLIGIRNELKSKSLHIVPVQGFPIRSRWQLVRSSSKPHSAVSKAFRNYLIKNKEAISKKWFN